MGCGISRLITTSSQPASQALTQNAQPPKGVDSGFGKAKNNIIWRHSLRKTIQHDKYTLGSRVLGGACIRGEAMKLKLHSLYSKSTSRPPHVRLGHSHPPLLEKANVSLLRHRGCGLRAEAIKTKDIRLCQTMTQAGYESVCKYLKGVSRERGKELFTVLGWTGNEGATK